MREASILVVGGGIAGLTAAIEAAETGRQVFLVEKEAYLGGRVAQMNKYFPKLCSPYCGLEINFRRIRENRNITVFTLAEIEGVAGEPGAFEVSVRLDPRYVNQKCTACGECVLHCPVERANAFNYGLDRTKAIYLPHEMAFPLTYAIDGAACLGARCARCVSVCQYGAIDLSMEARKIPLKVGALVLATGWQPYDATKIPNLGFGKHANVVTNVLLERLASVNGPTRGRISRLSDGREIRSIAFVQCAGSRDENHLRYCSSVCCLASLKQATYVLEQYPQAQVYIFYIDIRTPGRYEDFYVRVQRDERVTFIRGKVARIEADPQTKDLTVEAEDTLTGQRVRVLVDMAVLATGMVPEDWGVPGLNLARDRYGFAQANSGSGVYVAGVARQPMEAASSVRAGAAGALKAIQVAGQAHG